MPRLSVVPAALSVYLIDNSAFARAVHIRQALAQRGQRRGAQTTDVHVAAVAVRYGLTVLHYDRDFESIASCYPGLQHEWVVPRGSVG